MPWIPSYDAIDMPLRLLRSGVIDHIPWLVSIWVDRQCDR